MFNNIFVVGGPISVGKSTLVEKLPLGSVPELEDNNEIQSLMLEFTYNKKRVHPLVIEHYFLQLRKKRYIEHANELVPALFDRSIYESLWFAKENMSEKDFGFFEKMWEAEINDLISTYGKPKLYVLLTCGWETFKERFFKRGRDVEISNFSSNEEFFKKHIKDYEDHMIGVFKKFNLNYVVINTDGKNAEEVKKIAEKEMGL